MNERREDLLALLDAPDAAPEDLGPVLDALDALDGPSPFDTRAGWADLMARGTKKNPRKLWGKVPLAAVIARCVWRPLPRRLRPLACMTGLPAISALAMDRALCWKTL